jgi:hypothetical protein
MEINTVTYVPHICSAPRKYAQLPDAHFFMLIFLCPLFVRALLKAQMLTVSIHKVNEHTDVEPICYCLRGSLMRAMSKPSENFGRLNLCKQGD